MAPPHSAASGRPAPRMDTAAQARVLSVEDVMVLAAEGRLRIPNFQRAFKWELSDRRDLLDSIYRGYPVGTVLLWKNPPEGREAGRPLGPVDPPEHGDIFFVVDGQQRLTTLWEALGRAPAPTETALLFDVEEEKVISRRLTSDEIEGLPPPSADRLPPVPLHLVLDSAVLSAWPPAGMPLEDRRRYFELGKRIRDHKLGLYIVEHADVDALRHVFDRVNTTGRSMGRDDVFDALIGSKIARDEGAGLGLVNARLADLKFGEVPKKTLLRALEAVRGDQVGRLDPRNLEVEEAHSDLLRTADALRGAMLFLRDVAQVPHIAVRPYELPLVVLARFFALHPKPSERSLILLRRWFWRGTLGQRLTGASGSMQQHVSDVTEDEAGSVQALLGRTGTKDGVAFGDEQWGRMRKAYLSEALGKSVACALMAQRPRHLVAGDVLEPALWFGERSDILRTLSQKHLGWGIANKLLHPPGASVRSLILECTDEAALISHGIDAEAQEALRRGEVETFCQAREIRLRRGVETFIARNTELDRDDAPPLAALVAQGRA